MYEDLWSVHSELKSAFTVIGFPPSSPQQQESATPFTEAMAGSLSTSSPMPINLIQTNSNRPSPIKCFHLNPFRPSGHTISSRLLPVRITLLIFPIFPHLALVTT